MSNDIEALIERLNKYRHGYGNMSIACAEAATALAEAEKDRANLRKASTRLINLAADILLCKELPSPYVEDHQQKTYSASTIARVASNLKETNRLRAIEARSICDVIDAAINDAMKESKP